MQLFAGQSEEDFDERAEHATVYGNADLVVLRALAGMRKMTLSYYSRIYLDYYPK